MLLRLVSLGVLGTLIAFGALVAPAGAVTLPPVPPVEKRILNLEEALARTLRTSPDLAVAAGELSAAAADALHAGRLRNPELTVSLENVGGEGAYRGTDAAELTIELSQPIELGGKRRLRRETAELGRLLATHGQSLVRSEVLAATSQRFVAVLAAQEGLALATEQAALADKSLAAAEERIKAGKAPAIDRLRLQGEAGLARLALAQAERTLVTARQLLAAGWGEARPDFDHAAGDLDSLPAAPEPDEVGALLENSPVAVSRRLAVELLGKELEQARAGRIPDPSLTVGWRQFEESNEDAWLLGLSLPLPLFNQGQYEVAAASSRLQVAKAREFSARNQARTTLRAAWQALVDARAEAEVLASHIVPAAAEGFAAAGFGYQAGKFGLLELLDAQRTLFDARQQLLAARKNCHLAAIELQRLQGTEALGVTQQLHSP